LLNRNTALGLENIELTPPVKIPDDIFFVMCVIQAGQTDEELAARSKQVVEVSEKNGARDLGEIWERVAGPPRYWWYSSFADTMYGGSIKPKETGQVGLNSSCTLFYCPTMKLPEVYDLAHKVYVEKYGFPQENYLWYSWADRNAMDPYPMFFFNAADPKEIKRFSEFWRDLHLQLGKIGCVSYNVGIGHPKEFLEWLGPGYELVKRVKRLLDPNGILNPGA